jgi:hypothetical protein
VGRSGVGRHFGEDGFESASGAARLRTDCWARFKSVGFDPAVSRSFWAGSTRVNLERVCESLDGPVGDVIREAARAEVAKGIVGQGLPFAVDRRFPP